MLKHLRMFSLLIICLLLFPTPVEAQTAASVFLSPPRTEDFPQIIAQLRVFDDQGDFVHGLSAESLSIIEDNRNIRPSQIEELNNGTQFVAAINLGSTFAIRDNSGVSRYEKIRTVLTGWATSLPSTNTDDFSLLSNDGSEGVHLPSAQAWLATLEDYQTDARTATSSLDVLARAIQTAADPTPRPGMGRAILLLTPPPDRAAIGALQSLVSLAIQDEIRIYIWMVASPASFESEAASQLAQVAAQTGGQIFMYSGEEIIPDIESYLEPLRYIYHLTYESKINTSEMHTLQARVDNERFSVSSELQSFDLQVLPLNPIFITPPVQIVRANRTEFNTALSNESDFTPTSQSIEIVIEFPDGLPRPLDRTTLYVDGQIADENTSPPFDQFTWDLKEYAYSGSHQLQVEALDSLGLSGISIVTNIQITIVQTPQSIVASMARNGPLIAGAVAALAGSIFLLVLILGGRIQPRSFGRSDRQKNRLSHRDRKISQKDPVTQPVPVKPLPSRRRISGWVKRIQWPQHHTDTQAPAYLELREASNGFGAGTQIPILANEMTFGREPTLASITLGDPSVEDLHARLRKDQDGDFRLFDEESVAGTWSNYVPVAKEGTKLEHGDIIHIGRVEFRFTLSDTKHIPKPKVISLESKT
jgi:hypothetical protein